MEEQQIQPIEEVLPSKRKRDRHIKATESKRYIATYRRVASLTSGVINYVHLFKGKKKDTFVWRTPSGEESKPRTLEEIKKELDSDRINFVSGKLPKELKKPKPPRKKKTT